MEGIELNILHREVLWRTRKENVLLLRPGRGYESTHAFSVMHDEVEWSTLLMSARQKWSVPEKVREAVGRPPKRAKFARWRSQQQRAFAAGILHSVLIYTGLKPHEREIRAFLCARNLIENALVNSA